MEDFEHAKVHARYTSFYIDSEADKYMLHVTGYINGGAGEIYKQQIPTQGFRLRPI